LVLAGTHRPPDLYRVMKSWHVKSARWRSNSISRSYVNRILSNPYYCGKIRFRGTLYAASHKPMVTETEFAQVQRLISRRVDPRPIKLAFPYTGFIRHDCGCLVTASSKTKHYKTTNRTATYTYYHCTGSLGCAKRSISEDYISAKIVDSLAKVQISEHQARWCLWAFDQLDSVHEIDNREVDEANTVRVTAVQDNLKRLLDLLVRNRISEEEYEEAKKPLKAELAAAQDAAETEEAKRALVRATLEERLSVGRLTPSDYLALSPEDKRTHALRLSNNYLLTLEDGKPNLVIHLDPVFQLFAAFEPSKRDSEKLKVGIARDENKHWWSLVANVRTAAAELIKRGEAEHAYR
ncbi:MAG TPA: recombinase family protein, partial [Fimbriimonadaceae bacterium]|nr:recombinase family protein [Fimbriimonadaceae bacterium]